MNQNLNEEVILTTSWPVLDFGADADPDIRERKTVQYQHIIFYMQIILYISE